MIGIKINGKLDSIIIYTKYNLRNSFNLLQGLHLSVNFIKTSKNKNRLDFLS